MYQRISQGDKVMITATDEFYQFIDGWVGRVAGFQNGLAWVVCQHDGTEKKFLVPSEQLILTVGE